MTTATAANEYPPGDDSYRDDVAAGVERTKSGWALHLGSGWSFLCPADSPVEPAPGMAVRLYGDGIGFAVRGLFLAGRRVYYLTAAEQDAEHDRWAEEQDRERRYDFEKNRADLDRRSADLPAPFRERLERFRRARPSFRWEYEPYELFVCEQAAEIAHALGTEAAVRAWAAIPCADRSAAVPGLSDGHSGNSLGCAVHLACLYLTRPESVPLAPGAMAPLIGQREYEPEPEGVTLGD